MKLKSKPNLSLFCLVAFSCLYMPFSYTLLAQSSADCIEALQFKDSLSSFTINRGIGKKLEIKGNAISNPHFFTKEHNTTWIQIAFTRECEFAFELIPDNADDDFDFIIFWGNNSSFCSQFPNNAPTPVRSNLARINPENRSITGLHPNFTNNFSAAGQNPSFSASLPVLNGDTIYIVFDSPYGNKGGFTIKNTSEFLIQIPQISEDKSQEESPLKGYMPAMTLRVLDEDGGIVPNPFAILKIGKQKISKFETNNVGEMVLRDEINGKKGHLVITQKDFLQHTFPLSWDGKSDSIATFTINRIKVGSKLQFENINFAPNSSVILAESLTELEDLRTFLLNNPLIYVEIGGHVNSPTKRNTFKNKKLSKSRAKVIHSYLLDNGVPNSNISFKGYGNSKMIYRNPANEKENKANRRVEVLVTQILT